MAAVFGANLNGYSLIRVPIFSELNSSCITFKPTEQLSSSSTADQNVNPSSLLRHLQGLKRCEYSFEFRWNGQLTQLQLLNKDFYHIAAGNVNLRKCMVE